MFALTFRSSFGLDWIVALFRLILQVIKTVTVGIAPEEVDKAKAEAEQMKRTLEDKQRAKEEELRQVKELLQNKHTSIMTSVTTNTKQHTQKIATAMDPQQEQWLGGSTLLFSSLFFLAC